MKPLRILSIDGGGIRGVIPALVLDHLERIADRPIVDLFDLIVGTSTGGIMALGLTMPGPKQRPQYSANDLSKLYTEQGQIIFPKEGGSLRDQLLNSAQRFGSKFGGNPNFAGNARYFPDGLENALQQAFGDTPLSSALADVAVTSYDSRSETPVVFRSSDARADPALDLLMRDAARATSAAPTFFPPVGIPWAGQERSFVDGGVWANNPAMVALQESLQLTAAQGAPGTNVSMVSIGTGVPPPQRNFNRNAPWLSTGRDLVAMGTGTNEAHHLIERVLRGGGPGQYWRFQVIDAAIGKAMDDASPARVRLLADAGAALIRANEQRLATVVETLIA